MVKVTINENLVPSRHAYVRDRPNHDLIHNVLLARKLIRVAAFVFQLNKSAVYSGFVNEFEDGFFTFYLRESGVVIRTLVLTGLGYSGELHIDVQDLQRAVCFDVWASLPCGRNLALSLV